ncbi:DUF5994 family protein [Streptomyces sp. NPDC059272]|uniref:DUF5994 family protein n=1 Tax=Streptomyces sp. NPDC059272 TaxID=3346800 RepID=UPI00368391D9
MNAPTDTHSSPTSLTPADADLRVAPGVEQSAPPLLRLRLAAHTVVPRRLDGAWWPYSYDLLTEVPRLLAGLPRAWGHMVSVMVSGRVWSAAPGRMLVANQVVRLHRTSAAHAPNTVVLLAPGRGRWDLLVVPPELTEEAAEPLMAAAVANLR